MSATSTSTTSPTTADPQPLYFNRELSWLDFNQRVLELALDSAIPLLERVKFLAIFSANLDEFFMKRVGGLQRQRAASVRELSLDGRSVQEQLTLIQQRVITMMETHLKCWLEDLEPCLVKEGVVIASYDKLDEANKAAADQFFIKQVFPILTPLAVDQGHPFPFISNLSKSIGVMLQQPGRTVPAFVRIKVPENLPRWVPLPTRLHFLPLEQVIIGNLSLLFPGMKVIEHGMFRATRNADLELDEDDADDLLELVAQELRRRRLARVVRLELPDTMSTEMRQFIIDGLEVDPHDIYIVRGPMDLDDLFSISAIDLPHLKYKHWRPLVSNRLNGDDTDFFSVIRSGDLLVHHPYECFTQSVERFVLTAVDDPRVLAIKMTLYRTSADTAFVPALIRAAEMGKQIAVLVELKARFDEQRNLELAQKLEKAGVHVVYGLVGLKTHCKVAMVVRDEPDGLRTYVHIGTGNYNARTATSYTDLGLFTCNPMITDDVIELFHYLTGLSLKRDHRKLLVAPVNMRDRFLAKIRREIEHATAGRKGQIIAKMNSLQDPKIITTLYEASQAGVQIDLIVRGFCCLRPGVTGLSENIRVMSVLGRFLEHSRIYYFHNNGDEEYYIGSADWMNRNLDWRVEAITPVEDPLLRPRLKEILDVMLEDYGHAWELNADGSWPRRQPPADKKHLRDPMDTQDVMICRALNGEKPNRRKC